MSTRPKRIRWLVLAGTILGMNFPCVTGPVGSSARAEEVRRITVEDVRFWAKPDYTRVVLDLSAEARYEVHELAADPAASKPLRIYIDIRETQIPSQMRTTMPVKDSLVTTIRMSQFDDRTARIVLDLKGHVRADVFALPDPYRIVMDLRNGVDGSAPAEKPARAVKDPSSDSVSIAQSAGLKIRRIVIDAGHGGKDPGAIGHKGLREKAVALALARKLREAIKRDLKLEAVLTRDQDEFLPLEERTAKGEALKGDLFVSIHLNANPQRHVSGIATYSLNFTYSDEESRIVAARENQMSEDKMSDLEVILGDLARTELINESSLLAPLVQKSIIKSVRKIAPDAKDLGAKHAPFFVLTANMPSVLIEASFITNPTEAKRLRDEKYQEAVARGIAEGIHRYINTLRHIGVE
ncbi:MAG: N-acetylmuramoyl-L-alanine amidase [Nitrospirae bacterium]|nr:N-acetylmuramoyl-L-alanine amidase [Nitrospirota bacterium]